ncbi:hypothetical protein HanXRQr2_Chr13g0615341 [Helianthus annuus]|uniref:Uncharacterized protein n=1 Tax=Helianthus annuus TaxID=4232 RepID=A0A9K3EPC8_HELAN|nr:hypothetical protein HanXRQr2_Chr13g0615341 [Helianthus annuus]
MKLTFLVVMLQYKKNSHLHMKVLKRNLNKLMIEVVKFRDLNVSQALFIYEINR